MFLGMALVLSQLSCSVLVDFSECDSGEDCATGVCQFGICTESTDRELVTDHIVEDTTWTSGNVYLLEKLTFIIPPATHD